MNEAWQWWADKLAGKPVEMNDSNPQAGFYRWPRKAQYGARKTFLPVAYWPGENGKLNCRIGDEDVSWERGEEIWKNVGNHPVSEHAYRAVAQDSLPWPDEHELVPMGDNLPPLEQTFDTVQDEIENLAREGLKRLEGPPIADQDEADRIANLADELARLWKLADDLRKAEKKPHDDAAVAVQKKWAPVLLRAETYRNLKYKLLTPWLNSLTEKAKQEAEAAAAAGDPVAAQDTRRPRAGTRGRAMTLRSTKYAEIVNYEETLKFFSESPDVKGLVQDLANRAVRAGVTVPGTNVIEERQAI